jgi:hypothetical protein
MFRGFVQRAGGGREGALVLALQDGCVPMLDEAEFAEWFEAYRSAFATRDGQKPSFAFRLGRVDTPHVQARFAAALGLYKQLTGFDETNVNAIIHHRVSLYGPPCPECSKPLRTPRARMCAACGWGM